MIEVQVYSSNILSFSLQYFFSQQKMNPRVVMLLAKQLQECQKKTPDGIRLIVNESDLTDIQADIEGPVGTPYEGGIFRCKLAVENDFPNNPPKGYFLTKIFHPNVSEKGEICVNTLKKDWNPASWSLINILQVVKCLLIVPFPESALNEQAGKLFMENYQQYFKHARLITEVHATPKQINQLKSVDNNAKTKSEVEEQKPEPISAPAKKENDNKKKWMKRI